MQYEGELVVVIGKKAKHLSEDEAFSCVLGYTIGKRRQRAHLASLGPNHVAL